jgi:hypothetical protein
MVCDHRQVERNHAHGAKLRLDLWQSARPGNRLVMRKNARAVACSLALIVIGPGQVMPSCLTCSIRQCIVSLLGQISMFVCVSITSYQSSLG